MNSTFQFFKTTMPSSRKADYYLGALNGCVFLDFNCSNEERVSLVRISFDGYGCCSLDDNSHTLDEDESQQFINNLKQAPLNQDLTTLLVKKLIERNKRHLWQDALEEYGFLNKR